MIIEVDPVHPQPRRIAQIVELARQGLIAYPTDTVYAVGCDLMNKRSMERLYALKGKPTKRPLSLLCADLKHASEYAEISDQAFMILRRILPGPYTIILRAGERVPRVLLTRQRTVGIRVPAAPVAVALVNALGRPLATTSAALPDEEPLIDASDIQDQLGHGIELILDGGSILNEPSTVLDLTGPAPVVLREGKGTLEGVLS